MQQRLEYINGLKGLAIFGVVLVHVGQSFNNVPMVIDRLADYGFRGVTLFFIVSSFTLSISLFGKPFLPTSYIAKRYFRIAPMYLIAMVFYGATGQMSHSINDYFLNAILMHGFSPSAQNSVVPGGWSVASEAIFYIMLPVLISHCDTLAKSLVGLGLALAIAVLSHLMLRYLLEGLYPSEQVGDFIHFSFPNNLPAFMSGIVLFHLSRSTAVAHALRPIAVWILVLAFVALILIGISPFQSIRNPLVAIVPLGTLVLASNFARHNPFNTRAIRHIGNVSFSIYLVHFFIIDAISYLIPQLLSSDIGFYVTLIITLAVSVAISTITNRLIEVPFIVWSRRIGAPKSERLA